MGQWIIIWLTIFGGGLTSPPSSPALEALANGPVEWFNHPQLTIQYWGSRSYRLEEYSPEAITIQEALNAKEDAVIAQILPEQQWTRFDQEEITPYTWKWCHLAVDQGHGRKARVSLRRPNWWLQAYGATQKGDTLPINLPELGISGKATVADLAPNQLDTRLWEYELDQEKEKSPITGKFAYQASNVWEFYFDNGEIIQATPVHPFWSLDDQRWEAIGNLKSGEAIKTQKGRARLDSFKVLKGVHWVYNLEVYRNHTYQVTQEAFLVHNICEELHQRLSDIVDGFKNLDCVPCADKLVKELKDSGTSGKLIEFPYDGGGMFSRSADKVISENGRHRAVLVDGKVYDNFNKGTPLDEWLNDFEGFGGKTYNADSFNVLEEF
ncbi:MAG: papain fold toxin domain-containing protein [Bacteroidota bacterium]